MNLIICMFTLFASSMNANLRKNAIRNYFQRLYDDEAKQPDGVVSRDHSNIFNNILQDGEVIVGDLGRVTEDRISTNKMSTESDVEEKGGTETLLQKYLKKLFVNKIKSALNIGQKSAENKLLVVLLPKTYKLVSPIVFHADAYYPHNTRGKKLEANTYETKEDRYKEILNQIKNHLSLSSIDNPEGGLILGGRRRAHKKRKSKAYKRNREERRKKLWENIQKIKKQIKVLEIEEEQEKKELEKKKQLINEVAEDWENEMKKKMRDEMNVIEEELYKIDTLMQSKYSGNHNESFTFKDVVNNNTGMLTDKGMKLLVEAYPDLEPYILKKYGATGRRGEVHHLESHDFQEYTFV